MRGRKEINLWKNPTIKKEDKQNRYNYKTEESKWDQVDEEEEGREEEEQKERNRNRTKGGWIEIGRQVIDRNRKEKVIQNLRNGAQ